MTTDKERKKLIDQSIRDGNTSAVKDLLTFNPELLYPRLWFPAILVGDLELTQVLLDHGLDPNESGAERKPLHFAAEQGKVEILKQLLARGADPNISDAHGLTPLDLACEFGADALYPELTHLLIATGAQRPFPTCIRLGDVAGVVDYLDEHPSALNEIPVTGVGTPLMMASRCGRIELVAELLHRGADVNALNPVDPESGAGGNSALWFAGQGRRRGRAGLAKLLIEAGARVSEPCEHRETPLHIAAAWNQFEVANVLIKAGADLNAKTKKGDIPLDYAIRWEFKEVEAVIRSGGQPLPAFAVVDI